MESVASHMLFPMRNKLIPVITYIITYALPPISELVVLTVSDMGGKTIGYFRRNLSRFYNAV